MQESFPLMISDFESTVDFSNPDLPTWPENKKCRLIRMLPWPGKTLFTGTKKEVIAEYQKIRAVQP